MRHGESEHNLNGEMALEGNSRLLGDDVHITPFSLGDDMPS